MEDEMPRDFKGVWIPKEIWLDERLNALEKVILCEVDSLCSDKNNCYASNEYLAQFCQCSETKVSQAINKLIELNYIVVTFFDGRRRHLKSSLTENVRQTYKKCKADLQKMQSHINNIENNIENNKESKKESFDDLINSYTENEELRAELKNHLATRKAKKATLTNRAIELSFIELNKLANNDSEKIEIVRQSIRNGWTGFFALKNKKVEQKPKKSNFSGRDYDNLNQFYIN